MAAWTHHRVLKLIFAPCAHCLPAADAANDRKALSQFDQAGPPLPVSVTPAALPDDDPAEMHEEGLTAHDEAPAAVEASEEPPLTPAQRAPPQAPAAPLTAGASPAEEAAEDSEVEISSTGHADGEDVPQTQRVCTPAEEVAEDLQVEAASTKHEHSEECQPAQPNAAAPAPEAEEEAAHKESGNVTEVGLLRTDIAGGMLRQTECPRHHSKLCAHHETVVTR